jgi:hypothetical protein
MILDILSSSIAVAGAAEFVVDNTVTSLPVESPPAEGLVFANANSVEWAEPGDHFLLTGVWVNIPYGFGQGVSKTTLGIAWQFEDNTFLGVNELAGNSILTLPNFCGPLDFPPSGLFLRSPSTNGPVRLVLTALDMNVSQVNAPDALQGLTVKVQIHLRVTHTKPFISGE